MLKKYFCKIIQSTKGAAMYLLLFVLLPFFMIVPAIAIDLSTYIAIKTQVQNAVDAAAIYALNNSAIDSYRADKILKLKPASYFGNEVKKGLINNIKANGSTFISIT